MRWLLYNVEEKFIVPYVYIITASHNKPTTKYNLRFNHYSHLPPWQDLDTCKTDHTLSIHGGLVSNDLCRKDSHFLFPIPVTKSYLHSLMSMLCWNLAVKQVHAFVSHQPRVNNGYAYTFTLSYQLRSCAVSPCNATSLCAPHFYWNTTFKQNLKLIHVKQKPMQSHQFWQTKKSNKNYPVVTSSFDTHSLPNLTYRCKNYSTQLSQI